MTTKKDLVAERTVQKNSAGMYLESGMRDYKLMLDAWLTRHDEESKWTFEICAISIPCSTLLSLSVELYLKVLLCQVHASRYKGHDLWKLYSVLPPKYKDELDEFYKQQRDLMPKQMVLDDIRLGFDGGKKMDAQEKDKSLAAVLKRNRKTFEEWRYVHERLFNKGALTFELASMANIAVALRRITEEGSSRGKYIGTLKFGNGHVIA